MSATSILDLSTELFHNGIFKYLGDIDIHNFGKCGNQRLKEISKGYVELGKFFKSCVSVFTSYVWLTLWPIIFRVIWS